MIVDVAVTITILWEAKTTCPRNPRGTQQTIDSVGIRVCLCPPRVCFPVLCKFWQLYGGVNDNLLQEGLCLTQVCCTKSPYPCGRPLLTHISTGDTKTLKIRSGSVSVGSPSMCKVLLEPSECFWKVWGLILNVLSPIHHLAGASPFLWTWGCSSRPPSPVLVAAPVLGRHPVLGRCPVLGHCPCPWLPPLTSDTG